MGKKAQEQVVQVPLDPIKGWASVQMDNRIRSLPGFIEGCKCKLTLAGDPSAFLDPAPDSLRLPMIVIGIASADTAGAWPFQRIDSMLRTRLNKDGEDVSFTRVEFRGAVGSVVAHFYVGPIQSENFPDSLAHDKLWLVLSKGSEADKASAMRGKGQTGLDDFAKDAASEIDDAFAEANQKE